MKKVLKILVTIWLLLSFGSSGQTGSGVVTIITLSMPRSIQFNPNGETLYLGTVFDGLMGKDEIKREDTIEAYSSKAGILIKKYKFNCALKCYNAPFTISKNGKQIYTPIGGERNTLFQILDIGTNKIQRVNNDGIKLISAGNGISISNNSKYLVIGGYYIYI